MALGSHALLFFCNYFFGLVLHCPFSQPFIVSLLAPLSDSFVLCATHI
jgi:hypothetical protein